MVICDFHLHIYPFYNTARLLDLAFNSLRALGCESLRSRGEANGNINSQAITVVCCLVERYDCHFFEEALQLADAGGRIGRWRLFRNDEGCSLRIENDSGQVLQLINGRQVVSAERIEILALAVEPQITAELKDGRPAELLIKQINALGGLAAINWAPFKWSGRRRVLVNELISGATSGERILSETSLRPSVCDAHPLIKMGRSKGLTIIYGSDPLPYPGEELSAGTFAGQLNGQVDTARPGEWLKGALRDPVAVQPIGKNRGLIRVLYRLFRNEFSRRFSKRY